MVFDFSVFQKAACGEHDKRSFEPLIQVILSLSRIAKREGILSLEDNIEGLTDPFLSTGLSMIVNGVAPEFFDEVMITSILSSGLKGKALLSRMIVYSGLHGISRGDDPDLVKTLLEAYVGFKISIPGEPDDSFSEMGSNP